MTGRPRYPRYGRFIATGASLGLLAAALVVRLASTGDDRYSVGAALLYIGLLCGLVGGILGGAAAVLLERNAERPADDKGAGP